MAPSWTEFRKRVKSRYSAWGRALWLSRRQHAETCRRLQREKAELAALLRESEVARQREQAAYREREAEWQRREAVARSRTPSPQLPDDPPLAGHG